MESEGDEIKSRQGSTLFSISVPNFDIIISEMGVQAQSQPKFKTYYH